MTDFLEKIPSPKRKVKSLTSNSAKTISAPGTSTIRVAQACDRCRAKKTKCDGKLPCSSCASVGFKCIVSDKLSRRAFPKGYTETLEERIRQLEAENKKLTGLLDLRDEQISMLNAQSPLTAMDTDNSNIVGINSSNDTTNSSHTKIKEEFQSENKLTSSNLTLLETQNQTDALHSHLHDHHDGVPCSCSDFPNSVHETPVSIAGSYFDENQNKHSVSIPGSIQLTDNEDNESLLSFDDVQLIDSVHTNTNNGNSRRDVSPAPGAFAAATAIAQMQKVRQQQLPLQNSDRQILTSLVAISIPRLTEETLFIPTLLAKICEVYGYSSKSAILTANAIASLKETAQVKNNQELYDSDSNKLLISLLMNRYDIHNQLPDSEASFFIHNLLNLPSSKIDLDQLITIYFQDWGNTFPILDKNSFLKEYIQFSKYLDDSNVKNCLQSYELVEKFAAILVLVLSLSLISSKYTSQSESVKKYQLSHLNHFDYLIREFTKPNCIITKSCSIQSLQILSLALQYCLVTGDISSCYELRGRVITMGQQLRLHRCPAAVLGIDETNGSAVKNNNNSKGNNNVNLQNFRQGERRILFWCIYSLDVYSSLSLGVPRLLKDFEIECAIPFAGKEGEDEDDVNGNGNVNILIVNNTKLTIVGKVSRYTLSIMLYSKVLANILDSIFSRYENGDQSSKTLGRERMLDCWRRELPRELKFEIDVNGLSLANNKDPSAAINGNIWKNYTRQQLALIFLYYHAKILIYLPIISKHSHHHNVGLLQKEQLFKPKGDFTTNVVSSASIIQQSSIQILEILKSLSSYSSSYLLPIPISLAREQARLALLVARGSLDYVKNGSLYQNLRTLLLETISALSTDSEYAGPGGLTKNSVKLLELAILSILGLNLNKSLVGKKKPVNSFTNGRIIKDSEYDNFNKSNNGIKVSPTGKTSNSGTTTPTYSSKLSNVQSASEEYDIDNSSYPGSQLSTIDVDAINNNPIASNVYPDGIDDILEFDPFKMNLNPDLMMNEFAADGSLGLVPFLEMNNSVEYGANDWTTEE